MIPLIKINEPGHETLTNNEAAQNKCKLMQINDNLWQSMKINESNYMIQLMKISGLDQEKLTNNAAAQN